MTPLGFSVTLTCINDSTSTGTPTASACTSAGEYTVTDPCYLPFPESEKGAVFKSEVGNLEYTGYYGGQVDFFSEYGPMESWNTKKVKAMDMAFSTRGILKDKAGRFNSYIGDWDVGQVTTMNHMFAGAAVFDSVIGSWDVRKVTNMKSMFYLAQEFDADISSWDVSQVDDMERMFSSAYAFNGDISKWDVGKVTKMESIFYKTYNFNSDISTWVVSSVDQKSVDAGYDPCPTWCSCGGTVEGKLCGYYGCEKLKDVMKFPKFC